MSTERYNGWIWRCPKCLIGYTVMANEEGVHPVMRCVVCKCYHNEFGHVHNEDREVDFD